MAVFRIEKTRDYTVMSNHHLRNTNLSLKAKGLLSLMFGLTKRQLVCFSAATLIGVPLFFLLRNTVNSSTATVCMIVVMLPLFLLAMYERHGQPLEVVAAQIIQTAFLRPKERPYMTNNYYVAVERQIQVEKEVRSIVQKSIPKESAGAADKGKAKADCR